MQKPTLKNWGGLIQQIHSTNTKVVSEFLHEDLLHMKYALVR